MFKTINGGATWTFIYALSNHSEYKLQFVDSDNGFMLGSYAHEIMKTTDGGLSWTSLNTNFMPDDFYFRDSQNGWVTVSRYDSLTQGIYFTADGGNSFVQQDTAALFLLSYVNENLMYAASPNLLYKTDPSTLFISTPDLVIKNQVSVYPNPTSGKINIKSNEKIISYELHSLTGKLIDKKNVFETSFSLNKNLVEGIYFINLFFKNSNIVRKIIITK